MQIQDVFSRYEEPLKRVESFMTEQLRSDVPLITEVINHLVGGGGKRFRPLLLLVSADLSGYHGDRSYPLAAVVEFIHTATLLHDDVVDGADTRRGRRSANHLWGNATSVLVGDYLYSKAFNILAEDGNMAIISLMATGTNAMSEGEVLQLTKCGDTSLSEKDYFTVIERKTAILISAACAMGGILGGLPSEKIHALTRFGLRLGSAFQITDDILDYTACEVEFGKAIGKDLIEGKITLPLIRTMKRCNGQERERIREIIANREQAAPPAAGEILDLVDKYDGIAYSTEKAKNCIREAEGLLHNFPDSPARDSLFAITDYIIARRL